MLTLAEFADDEATTTVTYRKHTVEFTFKPGAYTGELVLKSTRLAAILAGCVTKWNIEGAPIDEATIEKLPTGLIAKMHAKVVELATDANLGEASKNSATG